mmetsp:Transcript_27421/g.64246  ORF Transcript_27421/g.64246 Transcript_27421/m.64246 type:complete len:210 (+) Transcript_27421:205-834(+)
MRRLPDPGVARSMRRRRGGRRSTRAGPPATPRPSGRRRIRAPVPDPRCRRRCCPRSTRSRRRARTIDLRRGRPARRARRCRRDTGSRRTGRSRRRPRSSPPGSTGRRRCPRCGCPAGISSGPPTGPGFRARFPSAGCPTGPPAGACRLRRCPRSPRGSVRRGRSRTDRFAGCSIGGKRTGGSPSAGSFQGGSRRACGTPKIRERSRSGR